MPGSAPATGSGLPVSRLRVAVSWSAAATIASAKASMALRRPSSSVRQSRWARAAARTAASSWSGPASGAWAVTVPVAGSTTSNVPAPATACPSMVIACMVPSLLPVRCGDRRNAVELEVDFLGRLDADADVLHDLRAGSDPEVGEPAEQPADRDLQLQPGGVLAEAPVDADAERRVRIALPAEVELVPVRELGLIPVARAPVHGQPLAGLERHAEQVVVLGDQAPHHRDGRGVAEQLVQVAFGPVRAAQALLQAIFGGQEAADIGQRTPGGVQPAEQQDRDDPEPFGLGERAAALYGGVDERL